MFDFSPAKKIQKQIALPYEVVLELQDDGLFLATCPALPGCSARGKTKTEALRHMEEASQLYLKRAGQAPFELVSEDAAHPCFHSLSAFYGHLVAASNRDGAFMSRSGDYGTWSARSVSSVAKPSANGNGNGNGHGNGHRLFLEEGAEGEGGLVDFATQIYCLAPFAGGGTPRLYAGTSASGSIFESVDGQHWELAYSTGEARVHCLGVFRSRLYAGTSAAGKLFCFTGSHWSLVHRSTEGALTALAEFKGDLFMGTYPGGQVYRSPDGVQWRQVFDSGQTFVRAFAVFQGALYAATSKAGGGIVFRSSDGQRWEKVFESRDPNFYCMLSFHHSLWLGTGSNGRLYRTLDGARWDLAASFEEEGIRSLEAFEGRLYVGTDGRGRIYRSSFADHTPPALRNIAVTSVGADFAVIEWETDRAADSLVRWGAGPAYEDSLNRQALTTRHRILLAGLSSLTQYHYQVQSRCPDGSDAAFSDDLVFRTITAEPVEIQSPSHAGPSRWYDSLEAVFSWSKPEGIDGYFICLDSMAATVPADGQAGTRFTQEQSATFSLPGDGTWYFHLLARDKTGHLSPPARHFKVQADTRALPPKLSSSTHPVRGAWSNRAAVSWEWEAPEDLSGVAGYYALLDENADSLPGPQSGFWTEEQRFAAELPHDGDWHFHVTTVDKAGNLGKQAAHYSVRLDRRADPPAVASPSHPDPSRWINRADIEFSWKTPADASGITGYYFILDHKPDTLPNAQTGTFTLSGQASFHGKEDGTWYFHVVSQDQAGNVGQEASHTLVRVDTQALPPLLASPTHPGESWGRSRDAKIEITPPEDLSGIVGYYYAVDRDRNSVPTPEKGSYTAERTIEARGLADGVWYCHVVSRDAAGNIGAQAAHCELRVDTEALPPRVSSPSHPVPDDWYRQPVMELQWDPPSDLSGIVSYYYILDQVPDTVPTPGSGSRTGETRVKLGPKEQGIWYFHVVSQDKAGNVGTQAAHLKLRIDTQALPPRVQSPSHPDAKAWSNNARPRFEWFEPEDLSGIAGYYYCLDRSAATLPGPSAGQYTTQRVVNFDQGLEGDGTWYFHLVSKDLAGNTGTEATHYPLHLDTTALPPVIQSNSHPDRNAWSNNANPEFFWNAPEDHSGIVGYYTLLNRSQVTVPGEGSGTWTDQARVSFTGLEDGTWYLHVASKDACGNVGKQASHYPVHIDTQALPPAVSSPSLSEGSWSRNPSPAFTWTAPQDLSGIAGYYYLLDNQAVSVPTKETGQFTTGTLASFQRLSDGTHIFHIVSVDQAGNVGVQATHFSIHIDTEAEPPRVSSSTHPDPKLWSKHAAAQLAWQPPQEPSGVAGYFYCVDQAAETMPGPQSTWTTESQVSLAPLADGEWCFHIVTRDGAGNLSREATHFPFRIDTSCPIPALASSTHPNPEEWFRNTQPVFTWEDGEDLSGIEGHYWIFDQRPLTHVSPATGQFTTASQVALPAQEDGIWYFHLAAKDAAGNVSPASHLAVRIETVAPQSKLEPLPALINRTQFEVRFSGKDSDSGIAGYDVQVKEGGETWQDWLTQVTQTSAVFQGKDGSAYAFRCRAVDKAGNKEAFSEEPWAAITIDATPPEPVRNLAAKPGPKGCVMLTWEAAKDPVSGVAFYRVYRSTAPGINGVQVSQDKLQSRCTYIDAGTELSDGQLYYYTAMAVDQAGNECTQGNAQAACICDKVALPPVVSSTSHPIPVDWFNLKKVSLNWTAPPDSTSIVGYYFQVDQSLNTVPDEKKGTFTKESQAELGPLADGTWYFHIVSKDQAGNVGTEAAHYQFNIDTAKPPSPTPRSLSHPHPDVWYTDSNAVFSWNVPTDLSGVAGYLVVMDSQPNSLPDADSGLWTTQTTANFADVGEGVWYFHIVAKDRAGNVGDKAEHCRIQVAKTPPPPSIFSPTHPDPAAVYPGSEVSFEWSAPPYQPPIVAFHYLLDGNPQSAPDARSPRCVDGKLAFSNLDEGEWFLHVVSEDASGRIGRMASHFGLRIASCGSLAGLVTLPNGIMPAAGVQVELAKGGETRIASEKTDREGRFRFSAVPLGRYMLRILSGSLPVQVLDGILLDSAETTLALSTEICAFPNPSAGAGRVRFSLLAREEGTLNLKIYSEAGKAIHSSETPVKGPAYHVIEWEPGDLAPGQYLYQSIFKGSTGAIAKTPIRKLQITKN